MSLTRKDVLVSTWNEVIIQSYYYSNATWRPVLCQVGVSTSHSYVAELGFELVTLGSAEPAEPQSNLVEILRPSHPLRSCRDGKFT